MATTSPGRILRDLVTDSTIQVPGAFNALTARLVEQAGFNALYVSGATLAAATLGLPDFGLLTLTELTQHVRHIIRGLETPVMVDAGAGFGDGVNVERTVSELEQAGAAAIQLSDEQFPRRCGYVNEPTLLSPDEMCAKIHAAAAARQDADLILVARTNARLAEDLDSAISRARRYADAGADWIFPEGLSDKRDFEKFAAEIDLPLVANMTEFGPHPLRNLEELAELGFSVVLYPETLLRVAMKGVEAALNLLAEEGTQANLLDLMQTPEELDELLGTADYVARDRKNFNGV